MHIRVNFVIDPRAASWPDLAFLRERDIEQQPTRFVGGRNSWIAQTFVRLRDALAARGIEAVSGPRFQPGTLSVVHRDDANRFRSGSHASYLIVVRADRAPVHACDVAICQNGIAPGPQEMHIPLWPQPGLRPRDSRRGARVSRIAYLGRGTASPAWFRDPAFHQALAARGVDFEAREQDWHRCEDVDLVLAAREESDAILSTKPATKVYNGWLAGIPVLAAPEPAYRDVRRSALDFLEIGGPRDVLNAVDMLKAHPGVYEAMVRNGRLRGAEYGIAATRARWLRLIEEVAVPAFRQRRDEIERRAAWHFGAMVRQRGASRLHKWTAGLQRHALR
jgi:hypothetical protein